MGTTTSLLDAVCMAKENERIAQDSYADAAKNVDHWMGKRLFEQLSEFERHHYERLSALEKSLEESGEYIDYDGKEFPIPPVFEIKAAKEPDQKSIMKIISEAMALEKEAEKAYGNLAAQITDPKGHKMFLELSEEEHIHYRVLRDAYWNLNNTGVWKWSR